MSGKTNSKCSTVWRILTRKKVLSFDENDEKLNRVLGTLDLTALGVGATLGVGVYVIAGHVARDQAGPSVIISFLIAAFASFLAGLCYAEFGARAQKSGSAYTYTYVFLGEIMAFIVGWNLMLEYIIGAASVAKGISLYIDSLVNNAMRHKFEEIAPISWTFMGTYFDFFAFILPILFGIALAFGLKKSTLVNNGLTILNLGIVLIIVIAGAFKTNSYNWRIPESSSPEIGNGGFFPFGLKGTLEGAATCFFSFFGFDYIATTGEEVRNPRKSIPNAIMFSLAIIFVAYFAVSTVSTLMIPYYLQDIDAPLVYAFGEVGWNWAKIMVAVGGTIALLASLFGAMFPQSRILYAMAEDGLIFKIFGKINRTYSTPLYGTICAALLTGIFAGIFDINALVKMLSIGTLMAYTMVTVSILVMRYTDAQTENTESTSLVKPQTRITFMEFVAQLFIISHRKTPSAVSKFVVIVLIVFYSIFSVGLSLIIQYTYASMKEGQNLSIALVVVFSILLMTILLLITLQPKEKCYSPFKVPLVPLLPCISIFINIFLMLMLDSCTWIRFGIWMAIGVPIYIACACLKQKSTRHSLDIIAVDDKMHDSTFWRYNLSFESSIEELTNTNKFITYANTNHIDNMVPKSNGAIPKFIPVVLVDDETIGKNFKIDENLAQSTPKSKPPSPHRFDEICLVSEVGDSIQEKKEANGNIYFVGSEGINSKLLKSITDSHNAIQFLDNILDNENIIKSRRGSTADSTASAIFMEQSTLADVHQEDETSVIPEESSVEIISNDELMEIGRIVDEIISKAQEYAECNINENLAKLDKLKSNTLDDLTDIEIITEKESIQNIKERATFIVGKNDFNKEELDENQPILGPLQRKEFMAKLSSLLVINKANQDKPEPIKKREQERELLELQPVYKRSKSESSFDQLLENDQGINRENQKTVNTPPPPPKFDLVLYNSLGRIKKTKQDSNVSLKAKFNTEMYKETDVHELQPVYKRSKSESRFDKLLENDQSTTKENQKIVNTPPPPPPPKFDPVKYHSLGRIKNRNILAAIQEEVRPSLNFSQNDENDAEPVNPREAFKQKLEILLKRSASFDKSHPIEPVVKRSPQIVQERIPDVPHNATIQNVLKKIKSDTTNYSFENNRQYLNEIKNGLRANSSKFAPN